MRKPIKTLFRILSAVILTLLLIFLIYASIYYGANREARLAASSDQTVKVTHTAHYLFFDGPGTKTSYIFYPGGKVQAEAYAPLMRKIASRGVDAFLVNMPLRFAFFGVDRAGEIQKEYHYDHWYIGGHSLGGAIACSYASKHLENFDGAILLASYPTASLVPASGSFRVLSLYGSEDGVLNMDSFQKGRDFMPADYREIKIEGGNHAQFGNYGRQKGDGKALISTADQQNRVVEEIAGLDLPS